MLTLNIVLDIHDLENNYSLKPPLVVKIGRIDLMHNDVTRLDAREECWS
jgi:hypothetical protein